MGLGAWEKASGDTAALATEDAAHREPVPTIVIVGRINVAGIKVEVAGVRGRRTTRSGPVVPVDPSIVERGTVVVAGQQNNKVMQGMRELQEIQLTLRRTY